MSVSNQAKAPVESATNQTALVEFRELFAGAIAALNTESPDARFAAGVEFQNAFSVLDDQCVRAECDDDTVYLDSDYPFGLSDAGHRFEQVCQETGVVTLRVDFHPANICVTVLDSFTETSPVVIPQGQTAQSPAQFELALSAIELAMSNTSSPDGGDNPLLVSLAVEPDEVRIASNVFTCRWWQPSLYAGVSTCLNWFKR